MTGVYSQVTGVGGYLPDPIMTNDDFTKIIETTDQWIVERTGIRQRHIIAKGMVTSDMAVEAALIALKAAGRTVSDVDMIIVATTTPDMHFPATAAMVQSKLGARSGIAFDVQAVCSGFVYALSIADGFVARGHASCALVIGAEAMSRLLDYTDRGTCILFGDGAGAVVVEARPDEAGLPKGILGFHLGCDGTKKELLYADGGLFNPDPESGKLKMQGNQVFKQAVQKISQAIESALHNANLNVEDIDWFIPHQANQRILDGVAERLGLDTAKVISTVAHHANTSAASIPLAWYEATRDGRIKTGDVVLIEALGGGLTWGAVAIRL
jgi:3-oxoacyl-[acyl-carrier-protein] synthase III